MSACVRFWGLCQAVSESVKDGILCQAVSGRTGPCQGSGCLLKARRSPRPALWQRVWHAGGTVAGRAWSPCGVGVFARNPKCLQGGCSYR